MAMLSRFIHGTIGHMPNCPLCQTSSWSVIDVQSSRALGLRAVGPDVMDSYFSTTGLVCVNCAYVWLISSERINSWLAANPEGQDNG